ncbi:hypothetical protein PybrP1_002899 [[Pythium] brassicae (nom. inval.)]|nr:hypothetical protein PybrP1_002899 [[Pythium] brassicae (nom. inval.)]
MHASSAVRLRPGIILFDPRDLETAAVRRKTYALQLASPSSDDASSTDGSQRSGDNQLEHELPEEEEEDGDGGGGARDDRVRLQVIEEIWATEQAYVRDICTLHDFYIVPLEDNKHPIMEDAQIAVFFNNLRQLVMLNSKLLNDLTDIVERRVNSASGARAGALSGLSRLKPPSRRASNCSSTSPVAAAEGVGAVFCRYAPLFKLYAGYAKDFETVAELLRHYAEDARLGFAAFLASCRARSGSPKGFESLLIMPIQRIPRYKLLLERVLAHTRAGHRDATFVSEAVRGVSFAASFINETVRRQENLETVLQTQRQFGGQLALFTRDRRLVKAGKLVKMSTKRQEEVMLHLFNDILLYSGVLITGGYRIRRVVHLASKAAGVRCDLPATYDALVETKSLGADCGFLITSLEKTFVLFAATPAARTEWVDAIRDAIRDAQQLAAADRDGGAGEGPADAAALWVPDAVVGSCTICQSAFKVYFRRHHCRRCGAVVCGNCSGQRSLLFVGDSAREERVCNPCFKVLDLVKTAAFRWLARVIECRGVLRRKRWNKWSEHYFELKAGILKQYTLASRTGSGAKSCTDTLDLAGAIVLHRSDSRLQKNRFCFQVSTADGLFDQDPAPDDDAYPDAPLTSALMAKMSPLKQAVSRFGDAVRSRDSSASGMGSDASQPSFSKPLTDAAGWILCGSSYEEEMAWSTAIQRSADKALHRMRRSRVTESALTVSIDRTQSCGPGGLPSSGGSGGRHSDVTGVFVDESAKQEHRRLQILKEIIRSEESYVTCLGECTRIYVQPLLLRQLEGQKLYRRRQSKHKKSLLHPFGGSASSSITAAANGAFVQRALSNSSIQNVSSMRRLGGGSGGSSGSGLGASLSASDSRPGSSAGAAAQKLLVLDADMAIFFSSIDQICTLNQQLLEHLARHLEETRAQEDDDGVHRAGAIFNAYAPLFQLYTSYASRHESALNAIKSPQFAAFLKEMPADASVNRLRTYLNMPMERIPRYKLLLQELLASTASDHLDYAPLQSAISSMDLVASKIQEIIARRENARKIDEVGAKVGIDLRGKRFVKEGALRKVCRSKVQKYYFVLLEDAVVYGRQGGGLQKKKFRLIDLWECKVSDETESIPAVINTVAGTANSQNAFYFFSPLKSFILLTESEDEKAAWTSSIRESIARTLRGPTSTRRASIRSELLLSEESDAATDYELESAFVIKNGWLNVASSDHSRRPQRLWVSLTLQTLTLATAFKAAQPDEAISIELCEVAPMRAEGFFRLVYAVDEIRNEKKTFVFEAQTHPEREEWLRALTHCISGCSMPNMLDMRRRSINNATLAPVFMFNKVSNVCVICYHPFAVYRPRHHCRLCGCLVCGTCSKRKWTLAYSSSKKPSRVCDNCAKANASVASSLEAETY